MGGRESEARGRERISSLEEASVTEKPKLVLLVYGLACDHNLTGYKRGNSPFLWSFF